MMRVLMILGALLVGIAGLFMSVCGGGFFLVFMLNAVTAFFRRGAGAAAIDNVPMLVLAGGCCAVGVLLVWGCAKSIRKWWD
jgi:hypothetical protein